MKKLVAAAALLLMFVSCGTLWSAPPSGHSSIPRSDRINIMNNATAALVDEETGGIYCSGVFVNETDILTAKHCLIVDHEVLELFTVFSMEIPDSMYMSEVRVITRLDYTSGWLKPGRLAKVVAKSTGDMVILRLTHPTHHGIVSMGTKAPTTGELIDIVGHTAGFGWTYIAGTVAYENRTYGNPVFGSKSMYVQVSSDLAQGNSGCGVFNERAQLVGLVSFLATDAVSMSFAVHRNEIEHFLTKAKIAHH